MSRARWLPAPAAGVFAAVAWPAPGASAHIGEFDSTAEALRAWSLDPFVLLPLLLLGVLYARGAGMLLQRTRGGGRYGWRIFAYGAGLLALVVALLSPLDALSTMYVSAHMVQHLVLMQLAAPLLVLGAPMAVASVGWPPLRRLGVRMRGWRPGPLALVVAPLTVLVLHGVVVLAWHLPVLYNLALLTNLLHFLQHLTFLTTAMLFWWVVLPSAGRRADYPVSMGLVFIMAVVTGGLGALMTVAPAPWYDYQAYAGLAPLQDQQLAGAIMWVVGGTLYAATAVTVFVLWVKRGDEQAAADAGEPAAPESDPVSQHAGGRV